MSEKEFDLATRRVPLEEHGYIEFQFRIAIDLDLPPKEMYAEATRLEHVIDAYKQAFWDLQKSKKAEREAEKEKQVQAQEAQKVEDRKQLITELIASEPEAVKAKMADFGGLLDEPAAAALLLKEREVSKEPTSGAPREGAPSLPDTGTFFKGKYGWSLYTDPEAIGEIREWLLSIPMEDRGRKKPDLPQISENKKALFVNAKEKAIYKAEAESQGKRTYDKEGKT